MMLFFFTKLQKNRKKKERISTQTAMISLIIYIFPLLFNNNKKK